MRRNRPNKTNKLKKEITLLTLLANEATSDSRKLLKKYGISDADNHVDLELKLAKLYSETPDKKVLEKEMAEIHPHKNWFVKTLMPEKEIKKEDSDTVIVETDTKTGKTTVDSFSNCSGNMNCPCNRMSNACGGGCPISSSFSGISESKESKSEKSDTPLILGVLGLVAIVAFYVNKKS